MNMVDCFGIECLSYEDIRMHETDNDGLYFTITGTNNGFYCIGKDNSRKYISETEMARKYLYSGRGVRLGGRIIFKKDAPGMTYGIFLKNHEKRKQEIERNKAEYRKVLHGTLLDSLCDETDFAIAQALIILYESEVVTEESFMSRLDKYLKPGTLSLVMRELTTNMLKTG